MQLQKIAEGASIPAAAELALSGCHGRQTSMSHESAHQGLHGQAGVHWRARQHDCLQRTPDSFDLAAAAAAAAADGAAAAGAAAAAGGEHTPCQVCQAQAALWAALWPLHAAGLQSCPCGLRVPWAAAWAACSTTCCMLRVRNHSLGLIQHVLGQGLHA